MCSSDYRYLYKTFHEKLQMNILIFYTQISSNAKPISHVSYEHFHNEDTTLRALKEFMKKF